MRLIDRVVDYVADRVLDRAEARKPAGPRVTTNIHNVTVKDVGDLERQMKYRGRSA